MPKLKNLGKNLLLLFVTILIFLFFFEIFLRVFYPQEIFPVNIYENSPTRRYVLKKNFFGTHYHPEFTVHYKTNSKGLRDYEHNYEKKNNTFRILVLGDSMTFGEGVEVNESYPKILEKLLNNNTQGKKFEVINAALPAQNTDQELIYFMEEGYKYNPDLIILGFYIGNDIYGNYYWPVVLVDNGTMKHRKLNYYDITLRKYDKFIPFYHFLVTHSQAIVFFKFKISAILHNLRRREVNINENSSFTTRSLFLIDETPLWHKVWNLTYFLIKKTNDEIKEKNNSTKFVIVLIPHRVQVYEELWDEEFFNNTKANSELPNNLIKNFSRMENITIIDLLPKFKKFAEEGKQLYYKIDEHLNKEGNKLAAEIIYDELINKGLIPIINSN